MGMLVQRIEAIFTSSKIGKSFQTLRDAFQKGRTVECNASPRKFRETYEPIQSADQLNSFIQNLQAGSPNSPPLQCRVKWQDAKTKGEEYYSVTFTKRSADYYELAVMYTPVDPKTPQWTGFTLENANIGIDTFEAISHGGGTLKCGALAGGTVLETLKRICPLK